MLWSYWGSTVKRIHHRFSDLTSDFQYVVFKVFQSVGKWFFLNVRILFVDIVDVYADRLPIGGVGHGEQLAPRPCHHLVSGPLPTQVIQRTHFFYCVQLLWPSTKKKESKIFSRAFFQIFDLKYNVSRFILVFWYRVYHNNQLLWFACIHQPQIQFSNFPRIQASLDLKCSTFAWSSSIHSLICCVCYCQVHPPGERVVRKFPDPAHLHHALHLPLLGQGPALQV